MSLLYRYTAGVHADTPATPWDTGRTGVTIESTPATRLAMYDAIAAALYTAGWTRYDRQLAGASGTANTNRDDVWYSSGEAGDKHLVFRTALSNSGAAGDRYLWWTIAPKRDDSATAALQQINWAGVATTLLTTDTTQLRARSGSLPGSFVREDADGQWFEVTAIDPGVSIDIDAAGFTIPNTGAANSSILTPVLEAEIGSQAFVNTAPFTDDNHRWDLTAGDFNADFQILVDKDSIEAILQNTNHTSTMRHALIGDGVPFDVNTNHMVLGSAVVSGGFVTLTTLDPITKAPINPLSIGWRLMDHFQLVNVDANGVARAETQVIVDISATDVTARRLRYNYDGDDQSVNPQVEGARIGMLPMPIMKSIGENQEIEASATLRPVNTPFFASELDRGVSGTAGDLTEPSTSGDGRGQLDEYDITYAQLHTHAQTNDEYGSGTSGNERTLRFTQRTVALEDTTKSTAMKIPKLEAYPGSVVYYTHDNMLRDRVTPAEDFVPFRFTATSSRNYVLGPTPGP